MDLDILFESPKDEAIGIEINGFIDGTEPETTYGSSFSSSCSSTNNESTSLLSNTTTATHPTSDSLFSSSDFSVKPVTIPTVAANTGNEHLPGTCTHRDKATKEDTCLIPYPHFGLFSGSKNIWYSFNEYSQLSWDKAYDLGDSLGFFGNYYPLSETDEGADIASSTTARLKP